MAAHAEPPKEDIEKQAEDLRLLVIEGEKTEQFIKDPIWQLIEEEGMLRLAQSGKALRKAFDLLSIGREQGKMEALETLLRFPKAMIQAGKEAKQELTDLEGDKQ